MFNSTNSLTQNFLGRVQKTPVQTSRYLWHITYEHYDRDLEIAAYGLLCPENYAVFAHSNVFSFNKTYPYFMDVWEFDIEEIEHSCQFSAYSFWRIDTRLANVDWFVDPNMMDETHIEGFNCKNYVCSLNNIPNYSLKLFKYNRDRYVSKRPIITRREGVASVRPYRNDFDSLVPDIEINNYIQWPSQNIPPCI